MKVLHVITGLNTGGAERALFNVLTSGLGDGFDNRVVSLTEEGSFATRIRELGVPVVALGMGRTHQSCAALGQFRRIIREFHPNVVQGWMYHGNLAAIFAPWLVGQHLPVVWNIRHSLYSLAHEKQGTRWVIRGNRFLSSRAGAIIYNSALSRSQHETFGFAAERGQVISNGFDLDRWKPDAKAYAAVRAELGIPDESPLIGHIARFHPLKDHWTFLQALGKVAPKVPRAHFLLAGRNVDSDNPEIAAWLTDLPDLSVERVHLLGERSDVERLMPALDVFCLSSWSEAFPNVLGEAMACGVPCVSTDVGDSRPIVGETGFIVPPKEPRALAEALITILDKTREERAVLGHAARERVRAHYRLAAVVERYRALYDELIRESE